MLRQHLSTGLRNLGSLHGDITVCLVVAWLIIFLSLIKGIKSSGNIYAVEYNRLYNLCGERRVCFDVRRDRIEGCGKIMLLNRIESPAIIDY